MVELKRAPLPYETSQSHQVGIPGPSAKEFSTSTDSVDNDAEESGSSTVQPWKILFPALFTSAPQPLATGSTDITNAAAVDALPAESTPQAEPPLPRLGKPKDQGIDPRRVSVLVPHRIQLLGVHGAEERSKLNWLR